MARDVAERLCRDLRRLRARPHETLGALADLLAARATASDPVVLVEDLLEIGRAHV